MPENVVEQAFIKIVGQAERLDGLSALLWEGISSSTGRVRRNGHPTSRLPRVLSVSFGGIEEEGILLNLDLDGVAASSGSACASESLKPSHALTAMGIEPAAAQGTIRFSLGRSTTREDIDYIVGVLPAIVNRLRRMSPLV